MSPLPSEALECLELQIPSFIKVILGIDSSSRNREGVAAGQPLSFDPMHASQMVGALVRPAGTVSAIGDGKITPRALPPSRVLSRLDARKAVDHAPGSFLSLITVSPIFFV